MIKNTDIIKTLKKYISDGIKKFVIYPYGENGLYLNNILVSCFNLPPYLIVDNELSKYNDNIIIEQEESGIMTCVISELWKDKDKEAKLSIDMWKKFRVLTTEDLESINK